MNINYGFHENLLKSVGSSKKNHTCRTLLTSVESHRLTPLTLVLMPAISPAPLEGEETPVDLQHVSKASLLSSPYTPVLAFPLLSSFSQCPLKCLYKYGVSLHRERAK